MDELESLRLLASEGYLSQALKSLDERGSAQDLVRQQYTGRYPFELLQNANDAAAGAVGERRVVFQLTASALVVANRGNGFGEAEVQAICSLGRSSKDPRKSVGYKGLGFKAVGEITDTPQIFSPPYMFGFDSRRAREEVGRAVGGDLPDRQHLPVYAFPFPLELTAAREDEAVVSGLLAEGFVSVLRLPFRADVSRHTVRGHLTDVLVAELLLFLDSTDSLEVRRSDKPLRVRITRDRRGDHEVATLSRNGADEQWLVFRNRAVPDPSLVERLGDAWRQVTEVSVSAAIPLDSAGRPAGGPPRPLHVYFPLADSVGLPALLHADFSLDLDRRRVSETPEAKPYNDWLRGELLGFVAGIVAPRLAAMFPGHGGVVSALAPTVATPGFGMLTRHFYNDRMASSAFVPCADGQARSPRDVLVLPPDVPQPGLIHLYCDLSRLGQLALVDDSFAAAADRWLRRDIKTRAVSSADLLAVLRDPGADCGAFYSWLVDWASLARPRQVFLTALADQRCVRTVAGGWVAPSSGVFFPRERSASVGVDDFPVDVAEVPEVDGLRDLLSDAGVNSWRWRELLVQHVLPQLSSPDTEPESRRRAHVALRAYFGSEDRGDQEVLRRLGDVLLTAQNADGTAVTLARARRIYLGQDWDPTGDLETIYGPFGRCEFLAEPVSDDPDARLGDLEYYGWLGVESRPRIDRAVADTAERFRLQLLSRHPHSAFGSWWTNWISSEPLLAARDCGQHHPGSQQLKTSYGLDRLPELVATGDTERLTLLARHLGAGWAHYRDAMTATVTCTHQGHHGERARAFPSVFRHILTEGAWLASLQRGTAALRQPREVWRPSPDLSRTARHWLAFLDPKLDVRQMVHAWIDLGVVDCARPRPADLVTLLRDLRHEWERGPSVPGHAEIPDVARWAMRQLNDALAHGANRGEDNLSQPVPLLATLDSQYLFTADPYVTDDILLKNTWGSECKILSADAGLTNLIHRLGLRRLADEVQIQPVPSGLLAVESEIVLYELLQVLPCLVAVAVATAPSRHDRIMSRVRHIEVIACERLELVSTMHGQQRQHPATCHIVRAPGSAQSGARTPSTTVYLQLDDDRRPNWYSLGPRLADLLDVPSQADAFTLLLNSDTGGREAYMRARGVELPTDVEPYGERPDGPDVETDEAQWPAERTTGDPNGRPGPATDAAQAPSSGETAPPVAGNARAGLSRPSRPEPPPLNTAVYRMTDPADTAVAPVAMTGLSRSSSTPAHTGGIDWDRSTETARANGRRGEAWAFIQEKTRLELLGLDPQVVQWISNIDEAANHDLKSLDEDGEPIFIEVKATDSSDPTTPFEISSGELAMANRHRNRYFVYHVLDVNAEAPQIIRYRDPLGRIQKGLGDLRTLRASMRLGGSPPRH
jgi:hypothetical protein